MQNSCPCLLYLYCSLCCLYVTAAVKKSGCDWEKGLNNGSSLGLLRGAANSLKHTVSTCSLVSATVWPPEENAAKGSGFKHLWTISNRYSCEERVCCGSSLLTVINQDRTRQNTSLCLHVTQYRLYIHTLINGTNMYCFVLYITHYKSYY